MDKPALAGTAGLLDPVLISLAREIAKIIPANSLLRSRFMESFMGAVRGFLEARTEQLPAVPAVVSEKALDVWGFVSAFLANSKKSLPETDPETIMLAAIAERLQKAEDPKKEAEKIKEELRLVKEIMDQARPEEESEDSAVLQVINKKLRKIRQDLQKRR
ncbi:MAG: hypothetical protein Q8Q95_03610 [bacterium]|nr:hypothetical protein [bacterium]